MLSRSLGCARPEPGFDQTSTLSRVVTWGGHYRLILIMAIAGFGMLAGLAPLTMAFSRASDFELSLLSLACVISAAALAGALSAILVTALAGVLAAILALVGVLAAMKVKLRFVINMPRGENLSPLPPLSQDANCIADYSGRVCS